MDLLENQQLAEAVDSSYIDLEAMLMQNIARHIRDYGQAIDSDKWLLQKLAEIGKLNKENMKLIAQMAGVSQTAAERMLQEAMDDAISATEPGFRYLVQQGLADDAVDVGKSKTVKQVIKSLYGQAKDTLNVCNTTMLYKARDAFSDLVHSIARSAGEIAGKQSFLDALGKHATAATIGAESRQQAVRKCIQEFNEKGIPAFVDRAGREWTPEAYVNMAMRNTARQTAEEVQTARCKDFGVNLISIDSHSGARPKCAKDQGKIFDLNDGSGYTEDLKGKKIKYYPWKDSSYGEPDGILGINCGHHKWPFIPGVNIHRYFPTDDLDANNKLYKETQIQRALERDVRKQKRKCMLFDEIGDEDAFRDVAVDLKEKEAALRAYVESKEHLHRRKDREQVVGFDKRISANAVAAKKYVDKYGAVRYNEDGTVVVTDNWKNRGHVSIPREYRENAVIETREMKGEHEQINRTFYDPEGRMCRQVHTGAHGNPKDHPYGEHGEHKHEYIWNDDGTLKERKTEELSEADRKENGDIL